MIVIVSKPGQLGNDLFLFGHFIAAAIEHDLRVANPSFNDSARFFATTARDPWVRFPPVSSRLPAIQGARDAAYLIASSTASVLFRAFGDKHVIRLDWHEAQDLADPEFLDRARQAPLLIVQGWLFRAENLFRKHALALRSFFRPNQEVCNAVAATVASSAPNEVTVGVHVRQGDYRRFQGGRYFYGTETYARMMRQTERLFPNHLVRFIVCSDEVQDPTWYEEFKWSPGPGTAIGDLYSLAATEYVIGPPSTFSLWANFYGDNRLFQLTDPDAPLELNSFKGYTQQV